VAWLINWADQHRIDTCSATDHPTIAGPSVWTSGTLEVNAGQRILDANSSSCSPKADRDTRTREK